MKRDPSSTKRASDAEKTSRDQLRSALKRAESDPGDDAVWDELEALAVATQETDDIAAAFRSVLAHGPERELVTRVGQRALRFLEEWYAGDANVLVDLLESILALDAGADWALERLTILRSVREQWHELLAAYDRVLEGLPDSPRRRKILQDAAAVARDSGDLARAVTYLRALFEIAPATADVAAELERLLDKLGDHVARAQVLGKRLGVLSGHEAVEVGQRLAGIYLDHLREPAKALDELARVLSSASLDDGDDSVACQLTERILGDSSLPMICASARSWCCVSGTCWRGATTVWLVPCGWLPSSPTSRSCRPWRARLPICSRARTICPRPASKWSSWSAYGPKMRRRGRVCASWPR